MKKPLPFLLLSLCFAGIAAGQVLAGTSCGEDARACADGEQCCQHAVATFCEHQTCAYQYVKSRCVPAGQSCKEFWCGSKQCRAGWFSTPEVCCVFQDTRGQSSYSCASSEISCPGNTAFLRIRPTLAKKNDE